MEHDEVVEIAKILADSLYDRGQHVDGWPEDEAALYQSEGGFMAGNRAVENLRYVKAAQALVARGFGRKKY